MEIKAKLLEIEPHVSKKTGNSYSLVFLKINDRMCKVIAVSDFSVSKDLIGKEGVATFDLAVYNLEASVRLKAFK